MPDLTSSLPGEYLQNAGSEHRHIGIDRLDQPKSAAFKASRKSEQLVPRLPEEILSLKVCDPACGSGTFPLNALRYLTEALYESLLYHKRFQYYADRTVIDLIVDATSQQTLADEKLPCRPEDNDFEARTKAVLRRYIVERCIYGVDLDPLAIELCRLSLWIETLDPRLPFTFLDHKIKCGNSLVGTWFDQFMHYPAMAWMREGGDKSHTNGVHFKKEAWTKQISSRLGDVKNKLIDFIDQQEYLSTGENLDQVQTLHDDAEKALARIHGMGVHEAQQRAIEYHQLRQSEAFEKAKFSLDLWCAIWFWPPEQIADCPLPNEFHAGQLPANASTIVRQLSSHWRFFHWQIEFPDVFSKTEDGFDAIVGNPPWDISKPNSKEFFSALDPLYRSYGKQDAIRKQSQAFAPSIEVERRWLNYNAQFRALSNWVKNSGAPYGNTILRDANGKESQDLNIGGGGGGSLQRSVRRHVKWMENREALSGYSRQLEDIRGFHHQGGGDINLYKMFLEQAHALLRNDGRMGFIVPSGIYSDHGTGTLRTLFLERCRWEWLFGFENREKVFDIDSRFKFNPLIIQKGGETDRIQTAFMRRDLRDWEQAEKYVTEYPRERVLQFSPRSKAILEIQSQRDLEVLEKIYSNGVLLGDQSPNGWGITYSREFDMTNDSKLFPPRDKWEERGYRPDEYSRWLRGKWRAIEELYAELGVKPLAEGEIRDVQPQYTHLPIPRADIPAGVILSRDGQSYLLETEIDTDEFLDKRGDSIPGPAIALPLYQGRMIWQFDYSYAVYEQVGSKKRDWIDPQPDQHVVSPQYLMPTSHYSNPTWRLGFRDVQNATNQKTLISTLLPAFPCGNKVANLNLRLTDSLRILPLITSFPIDRTLRRKMSQGTVNWFYIAELPLPDREERLGCFDHMSISLACNSVIFSELWLRVNRSNAIDTPWQKGWAITPHERMRIRCILHAIASEFLGLSVTDLKEVLRECAYPVDSLKSDRFCSTLDQKGFFRVGKMYDPELRETILSIVAFSELKQNGLPNFLNQNNGEGWQLPESIDLGDYDLGDGSGGRVEVRSRLGARYFSWQESQSVEESWRECHLHARNLLGPSGYASLLAELQSPPSDDAAPQSPQPDGISAGPSGPTASGSAASWSGRSAESSTASSSLVNSSTSPTIPSNASPLGDCPPFDPDTFTLSNAPVPKKRKKR